MFYYLYEIRNNLNGKIYVGVHKTKDMNDGYMGSGKVIKRAIEKHGIENFSKIILETFDNAEDMYAREKEVVNEEFLLREDTYNLRRGGYGGFEYINNNQLAPKRPWTDEDRLIAKQARMCLDWTSIHIEKYKNVSYDVRCEWSNNGRQAALCSDSIMKRKATFKKNKHQQGENNSQFGTMWITNGMVSTKIKKLDPIPVGWYKGRTTLTHPIDS